MAKPKMKETEIGEVIVAWLLESHWDVYQEVQFSRLGGVADIVAVRHGIIWIIETKVSYTMDVLQQASRWMAHYRSVGVPQCLDRFGRDYGVAERYYRVGVLEVSPGKKVDEKVDAPVITNNHKWAKRLMENLTEDHKTFAKAGSPAGSHLTPYKSTMMAIRKVVENNPGCTIKFLYEQLGSMHYSSKESFKGSVSKCLLSFEKVWCRVDVRGREYKLYVRDGAAPIWTPTIDHFVARTIFDEPRS